MRLDLHLKKIGLASSREKAQEAIKAGLVFVNGVCACKASASVKPEDKIELSNKKEVLNYVSRSALKLKSAALFWKIDFKDKIVLDLGSSTGGFTQFALEKGARKVYAIDVGTKQLHHSIKSDARVISIEGQDARTLKSSQVPDKIDILLADLSFISLFKVLPHVFHLLAPSAQALLLFKPQFESKNKKLLDKKYDLQKTLKDAHFEFARYPFENFYMAPISVYGKDGSREFLFLLEKFKGEAF